jgi:hypothetical protein
MEEVMSDPDEINKRIRYPNSEKMALLLCLGVDLGGEEYTGLLGQPGALPLDTYIARKHEELAQPGYYPVTSTSTESGVIHQYNLETLEKTINSIQAMFMQPMLRAIWFVDCDPQEEINFRNRLADLTDAAQFKVEHPQEYESIFQIPFLYWDSKTATIDDVKRILHAGRWFMSIPGIWLEMSDLNHKRIDL